MKPDREGESDPNIGRVETEQAEIWCSGWRAREGKPLRWCRSTKRSAVGAAEAGQAGRETTDRSHQQQTFLHFQIISNWFSLMDIPTCLHTPVQRHLSVYSAFLCSYFALFLLQLCPAACWKSLPWEISTPSTHDHSTLTPTFVFFFFKYTLSFNVISNQLCWSLVLLKHMNTEKRIKATFPNEQLASTASKSTESSGLPSLLLDFSPPLQEEHHEPLTFIWHKTFCRERNEKRLKITIISSNYK